MDKISEAPLGGGPSETGASGEIGGPSARNSSQDISRVGVRVPPFWPEEPEVWFAQMESQFVLSNISADLTKFHFVTSQLDQEYARIVKDIIVSPPANNKYDKIKTELIKRISLSHEKKTLQLMQHEELGDRKPSQFLRHLRNLAGPQVPDDFLRTVWTSRLPPNVQTIVASQPKSDLDDVADLADRVNDITPSVSHVASVAPSAHTSTLENKVAELTRQVEILSMQVKKANHFKNSKWQRSRSNSRHRSQDRSNQGYCYYHNKFGSRAKKCVPPCKFNSGNQKGSQ